jgi:hypothetical protein
MIRKLSRWIRRLRDWLRGLPVSQPEKPPAESKREEAACLSLQNPGLPVRRMGIF